MVYQHLYGLFIVEIWFIGKFFIIIKISYLIEIAAY